MNRYLVYLLLSFITITASAQGVIKGTVLDKNGNEPLQYVNVKVSTRSDSTFVKGAITDVNGKFSVSDLSNGKYILNVSYVGYKEVNRNFDITDDNKSVTYAALYIHEDAHMLQDVNVVGQKSTMKLEVDRKTFDVSQLIGNAGTSASEVLENIPSIEVDNDGNISLRGNESVEVWINGKSSGLTSDNRAQILQQIPAESIDRVEVIDNPSAKFSAEGSAGIINIILKKDRKAGYYGSVQAGVDTRGGANTSVNFNYNSKLFDAYANVGFRHRKNTDRSSSEQEYIKTGQYQNYNTNTDNIGNNLFSRAGITFHATDKDDFSLSGMLMAGKNNRWSTTPYHYGTIGASTDNYTMLRQSKSGGDMNMYYGEFNYRHTFRDSHFLDFVVNFNRWKMDNENVYKDSTTYYNPVAPTDYGYQSLPMHMNNRRWEVKLDYENKISDAMKIQAGYQGQFSHENTPQESYKDNQYWDGRNMVEDKNYFNRFIYDMDVHALYFTGQYQLGKLGIMAGLRGEYWKIDTESYTWAQEHDATLRDKPFKKDYFQLFPSLFMSYQITENDQLQLNYTRRLRRPWGGQLNSFKNTQDATMVSFGNPLLTPEYSNSFSLNYLKTWPLHSMLLSAYYRPTTDVIQRINYQSSSDGMMYQTSMNVAKSQSSGLELTVKDKFFRILDLTTNVNAYYYKLNGFSYDIDGQTVTGDENHNFTWNARMTASVILPYDISVQASGRYRSRQVITQGYRKPSYNVDLGARKSFFNKALMLAINCRDVFNSRKFENFTSSDSFTRHAMHSHGGRTVNFTLTYNFGNTRAKKKPQRDDMQNQQMDDTMPQGYGNMGDE